VSNLTNEERYLVEIAQLRMERDAARAEAKTLRQGLENIVQGVSGKSDWLHYLEPSGVVRLCQRVLNAAR
jgi:hypothetical protein